MRDYFNELYEWDETGNKRRKQRAAADGERFRFTMQMMDAAGFRPFFADGSPDCTSPHRPGHRFADTDDAAKIAAEEAYQERSRRLQDAWRNKGEQQREDSAPQHTRSLDEMRAAADQAYADRSVRMSNAWRTNR